MKSTILIHFLLVLFAFTTSKANTATNNIHDREYFRAFKKNEQPENKKFVLLNKVSTKKEASFYVVYKENALGQGFYFKVVLDQNEKPIATYYANENETIAPSTVQNLKNILRASPQATLSAGDTPAQCVTKCHRANNCYGQPTNTGVLLCSLDCQISCA